MCEGKVKNNKIFLNTCVLCWYILSQYVRSTVENYDILKDSISGDSMEYGSI